MTDGQRRGPTVPGPSRRPAARGLRDPERTHEQAATRQSPERGRRIVSTLEVDRQAWSPAPRTTCRPTGSCTAGCARRCWTETRSGERPLSRLGTGTYAGIFVTVALLAVAGIVGVLRPGGSNAWSEPGAFIVESETGARYRPSRRRTAPGAELRIGPSCCSGNSCTSCSVSVRSLESAPHGPPVGITSAPDSLPDAAHMAGSTWSVCAVGDASDGGRSARPSFPGGRRTATRCPAGRVTCCAPPMVGPSLSRRITPTRSPIDGWPSSATVAPRASR